MESSASDEKKYVPKGGPNGGDGGCGGNVIMKAIVTLAIYENFHFKPQWKARNGQPGMGRDKHGRNAENLIMKVPLGTVVIDQASEKPIIEILQHEQEFVLLEGGRGGLETATQVLDQPCASSVHAGNQVKKVSSSLY